MEKIEDKFPPKDLDAEESVIGSLLIDGTAIYKITSLLQPAYFYLEQNQWLYGACLALYQRNEAINQITVAQELSRQDKLEPCGGAAHLSHLIAICPTPLDIEYYAQIVYRLSIMRHLITAADQIKTIGFESSPNIESSLGQVDAIINALKKGAIKSEIVSPEERGGLLFQRYQELKNAENTIAVPTGFYDVDKELGGGFFAGELVVLGGDSGLGKSTLAQDIAINVSNIGDVLFCSGEMTIEAISDKEVAKIVGCPVIIVRAGQYDDELFAKIIDDGVGIISQRRIYFYRGIPLSINGIRQAAYKMSYEHDIKLIVVDYLQRIDMPKGDENTYRKIGFITTQLANLAKELNTPVLLCTQLGSDIDKRENKRPTAGDIYESKMISQDADVILLLYRLDKYFTQEDWRTEFQKRSGPRGWDNYRARDGETPVFPEGIAEVIIEKQRVGYGKRKIRKILWNKQHQSYQNLAHEGTEIGGEQW